MDGIKRGVAEAGLKLIAAEFRSSMSPYGATWAPLKYRKGKPLVKTGAMRDGFTASPLANGVRFQASVDYAIYHQTGTRSMVARPILPRSGQALPDAWRERITALYTRSARRQVAS